MSPPAARRESVSSTGREKRRSSAVEISTDHARLDRGRVHGWLSEQTPWARGITLARLTRAIDRSLCFGAYAAAGGAQVGFARVISDEATFAYLCDVFVDPAWRGTGVGSRLLQAIDAEPRLQALRRFALVTTDAHWLYERFGFAVVAQPHKWMERHTPDAHAAMEQPG